MIIWFTKDEMKDILAEAMYKKLESIVDKVNPEDCEFIDSDFLILDNVNFRFDTEVK